jgi:hypothetical protein
VALSVGARGGPGRIAHSKDGPRRLLWKAYREFLSFNPFHPPNAPEALLWEGRGLFPWHGELCPNRRLLAPEDRSAPFARSHKRVTTFMSRSPRLPLPARRPRNRL